MLFYSLLDGIFEQIYLALPQGNPEVEVNYTLKRKVINGKTDAKTGKIHKHRNPNSKDFIV